MEVLYAGVSLGESLPTVSVRKRFLLTVDMQVACEFAALCEAPPTVGARKWFLTHVQLQVLSKCRAVAQTLLTRCRKMVSPPSAHTCVW